MIKAGTKYTVIKSWKKLYHDLHVRSGYPCLWVQTWTGLTRLRVNSVSHACFTSMVDCRYKSGYPHVAPGNSTEHWNPGTHIDAYQTQDSLQHPNSSPAMPFASPAGVGRPGHGAKAGWTCPKWWQNQFVSNPKLSNLDGGTMRWWWGP